MSSERPAWFDVHSARIHELLWAIEPLPSNQGRP